jgi:hypothetical protein
VFRPAPPPIGIAAPLTNAGELDEEGDEIADLARFAEPAC